MLEYTHLFATFLLDGAENEPEYIYLHGPQLGNQNQILLVFPFGEERLP